MKMTFRWYGKNSDTVTLKQIRQIPGMSGLMGFLDYKPAGEVWTEEEIKAYIDEVHAAGLECEVIESVNVHEDIKLGLPTRDQYIENYRITIRNLAKYGVKVIVYNFNISTVKYRYSCIFTYEAESVNSNIIRFDINTNVIQSSIIT